MEVKVFDGDKFIYFKGYWVGENGEILSINQRVLKAFPSVKIDGKNYRKANLIASLWLGKPSEKSNVIHLDGNKKNCAVSNLAYKKADSEFKKYENEVREITESQPLHLLKDYNKRGFHTYHVDHIISIREGFINGIPTHVIGGIGNLQMLTRKENYKKGNLSYSVIEQCSHLKR